jgi:glycosyltransferase involved in cell wall biosynthesis
LFFGFVRKYKGLDVLLEALPLVLRKRRVRLMIVGEFWKDKQRYVNKISELELEDHITIIDAYVPNEQLGKYFHAADLVVQPYLSASGSGVSQLAYGFGKPVIATNVGSIAEVIVDGVNGRLVHPGNPGELAQAVVEALEAEKLKSMTMEAAKVKERFSWNRFAEMVASC